jgi:GntR family transcriptional regulator, vanillate catabolism transcriptional regulator
LTIKIIALHARPDWSKPLFSLKMAQPVPLSTAASATLKSSDGDNAQVRAQLQLREMILSGELQAGARIAELSLVERLGVSRTPIRSALMRLEQEGLMQALPHGGFAVRTFSEREVSEAIELRGMVEGLSARLAAERGAAPVVMSEARLVLQAIDGLLSAQALSEEDFSSYVHLNQKFHNLLGELSGSELLTREMERAASLPFASPSAFVVMQATSPKARDMLIVAQDQHWQVLEAIEQREGARAENLMREHSRLAQRNLRDAVRSPGAAMPGVQLIRKRSSFN